MIYRRKGTALDPANRPGVKVGNLLGPLPGSRAPLLAVKVTLPFNLTDWMRPNGRQFDQLWRIGCGLRASRASP